MQSNAKPKRNSDNGLKLGEYPALRQFIHGYLHEDYVDEYGSAEDAATEFWQDADPEEREQVAAEWRRFLKDTESLPASTVQRVLTEKFGSGWHFTDKEELHRISAVLLKRNHH